MATEDGEQLDFTSEHFDPLKALKADDVQLPVPNIRPLDNIAHYKSLMSKKHTSNEAKRKPSLAQRKNAMLSRIAKIENMQVSSENPKNEAKRRQQKQTVMSRMESAYEHGPLSRLRDCVMNRTRVKVWTRNYSEIRGILTGYILAFDKHWNLAMADVDESWQTTTSKYKSPVMGDLGMKNLSLVENPVIKPDSVSENWNLNKESCSSEKTKAVSEHSQAEIKDNEEEEAGRFGKGKPGNGASRGHRGGKKVCVMQRHVNQLFVRGDNVVMVAVMPI